MNDIRAVCKWAYAGESRENGRITSKKIHKQYTAWGGRENLEELGGDKMDHIKRKHR